MHHDHPRPRPEAPDSVYTVIVECGDGAALAGAALAGSIYRDGRLYLFRTGASDLRVSAAVRDEIARSQTAWTAIRVLSTPPEVQVTAPQAARLVGVSDRTVAALVHGGALAVSPSGTIALGHLVPLVAARQPR